MTEYLYTIPGWSPLEIADELGLTFRTVCNFIDTHCLRKLDCSVARKVRKATRADTYKPTPYWELPGWEPADASD